MNVGARLAEILAAVDGTVLFGVPGGQTLPLYQATRANGMTHVLMRDERNAATAADAYARVSGRVGVCDATVGPGVTNLVSGLAEALSSSVPVLALVADIRTDQQHLRRRSVVSQAVDQHALLAAVTKWVGRVEHPDAVDAVVDQALRVATTGRPGPVAVEIPEDLWLEETVAARRFGPADATVPRHRSAPDPAAVERAAAILRKSDRPIVLAGGGAVASGAAGSLRALVDQLAAPVVTTINGKGVVDERAGTSAGVVGLFGDARALRLLDAADVVLVVGSKLDQFSTHRWRVPRPDQTVIHVDVDGEELGRTGSVDVGLVGDAALTLEALRSELADAVASRPGWPLALELPRVPAADDGLHPGGVVARLGAALGVDDTVVCDASYASGWAARHVRVAAPGRFVAPRGLAGIGWSGGAAIGARLATGRGRVHVVAGDGGWAYGIAELETAARLGLDITYVVLDNAAYAWIVHGEERMGMDDRSRFGAVDFAAVARGFGASGLRATTIEEVGDALAGAAATSGPVVVHTPVSVSASPIVSLRDARALREGTSA